MNKEDLKFFLRVALSLVIGALVVYPLYLYGKHFLLP